MRSSMPCWKLEADLQHELIIKSPWINRTKGVEGLSFLVKIKVNCKFLVKSKNCQFQLCYQTLQINWITLKFNSTKLFCLSWTLIEPLCSFFMSLWSHGTSGWLWDCDSPLITYNVIKKRLLPWGPTQMLNFRARLLATIKCGFSATGR